MGAPCPKCKSSLTQSLSAICQGGTVGGPVNGTNYSYIANIENFIMFVGHSMQARQLYLQTHDERYAGSSDTMNGVLVDQNGNTMESFGRGVDQISVQELLNAAAVNLNAGSDVIGNEKEAARFSGLVILFSIEYSNIDAPQSKPTYTYSAQHIPGAEYKVIEIVYLNDTYRLNNNRHGIKAIFLQGGQIGRFDVQTTLIQLVSALGLLSVATLAVDFLMLAGLPQRRLYKQFKVEETVDFSDLREGLLANEEKKAEEEEERGAPLEK